MGQMRHRPPAGHGGGQMPPEVQHVEYSDTDGTIRFANGLCTLRATSDTLTLRVDADDEDTLWRLQKGIAGRVEKIGRRDQLTVTWSQIQASEGSPRKAADGTANAPDAGGVKRRGLGKATGLGAVGIRSTGCFAGGSATGPGRGS
jgi:hypothetical protein